MKKVFAFLSDNILFLVTLLFLVFIPLYPKLPLLDLKNTWVYIRIEDFLMVFIWLIFFIQLLRKKATLITPLTIPIVVFWIIGGLATLHGVLFLFPNLQGVFPNLAIFHYLRHIEYLSVFFLGYVSIKKKSFVTPLVITLAVTLIIVFLYGLGQRYLGLPAYLTMNEEFAKGIPLRLSPLARIPSTFAGHYDLAAYLALLIPIMGSLVFGFKKWYAKIFFFLTALSGLILLLLTASRVSFGVYLVSITVLLILQKQKKFILPVIIGSILLLQAFPGLSSRLASTFQQVDLVVDSRSGKAIGVASEFGNGQIVIEDEQSNGENLPQGSKYINVPSQTDTGTDTQIVYKRLTPGSNEPQIISRTGKVIVKKAFAYDVSFTTRFQGEWPRALEALKRNYLFGSGYSSISLATDNNYLRILGEIGILGFLSFVSIFLIGFIFLWRVLPAVTDAKTRALILGVSAGLLGVSLNAILIDVFEASKLAFVMWAILGATLGLANLYKKDNISYLLELKRIFTSPVSYVIYLITSGILLFSSTLSNYFVADDFTWLRWAADCSTRVRGACEGFLPTVSSFFLNAQDFYYRPGMKTFFYIVYPVFEIFPTPYHVISLLAHLLSTVLIFFLSRHFLKQDVFAFAASFLFLVLGIHFETIFWISTLGHVIASTLILGALLAYLHYRGNEKIFLLGISWLCLLVATFFHEFAIIGVVLLLVFDIVLKGNLKLTNLKSKIWYLFFVFLIPLYYLMRSNASSLWFSGDYSYSLPHLPFNLFGNAVSYVFITLFGPPIIVPLQNLRILAAANSLLTGGIMLLVLVISLLFLRSVKDKIDSKMRKMILLSSLIFLIPLIPFLGLGNISPRYVYLGSFGICLFLAFLLQNTYTKLKKEHRKTLGLTYVLIFAFFTIFQASHLLNLNKDWQKAGEIVNNTLVNIAISVNQENQIPLVNPTFYFINVPIRYGSAWVFPVGLKDALWFGYRNNDLKIDSSTPELEAKSRADTDVNVKVFKFLEDGSLVEYTPPITPSPML